jgi:hypothetical protein
MAFIARKPFLFEGVSYLPGDVVEGFPEKFNRAEGFIHAGFIVEKKPTEVKPPVAKKTVMKKTTRAKSGA